MKANEFVKKFGWDATIDLWRGAFDLYNNDLLILSGMVCSFSDNKFLFDLGDIKRLVESYALVEQYNGLFEAKELIRVSPNMTSELRELEAAIKDVESCL